MDSDDIDNSMEHGCKCMQSFFKKDMRGRGAEAREPVTVVGGEVVKSRFY